MEEATADTGVCMQAYHTFQPAGKDGNRRTAQSETGHRRLPADEGYAADDSRKDGGTQPRVADFHRHFGLELVDAEKTE